MSSSRLASLKPPCQACLVVVIAVVQACGRWCCAGPITQLMGLSQPPLRSWVVAVLLADPAFVHLVLQCCPAGHVFLFGFGVMVKLAGQVPDLHVVIASAAQCIASAA